MKDFVKEEDRRRGRARWGIFVVVLGDGKTSRKRVNQKLPALAEQEVKGKGLRRRKRRGGILERSGI
jgi:hypothetical protein